MFLKILLIFIYYPLLLVFYFILRNEIVPKKNIVLGVTLPQTALSDAEVMKIAEDFRRALNKTVLLLALPPLTVFFLDYTSLIVAVFLNWTVVAVIVPFIPYIKYHRKLKALKQKRAWKQDLNPEIFARLKAEAEVNVEIKTWLFIPAILLSVFPFVYELTAGRAQVHFAVLWGCGTMLLLTVLFFIISRFHARQSPEIIAADSNFNAALTRARKQNWARFWPAAAWLNAVYGIFFWLGATGRMSFPGFMLMTLLYTLALLWAALKAEFATRKMQHELALASKFPVYMDEDSSWILGMFYYNPRDKKNLVNNRVGMGMTFNLARTPGKVLTVFALLSLLAMPFLSLWLVAEEFTPIKAEVRDRAVVISHLREIAAIKAAEIEEIAVLAELPRARKIVGTGMDSLLKGTFDVEGYGRGKLYLNPQKPPFMLLKTRQGYVIINFNREVLALTQNT